MQLIPVTDLNSPELEVYSSLRDRATTRDNSFVADSPKVINELLKSGAEVKSILATQEYYDTYGELLTSYDDARFYVAPKELMQTIVGHKLHHNAMMHGIRPADTPLEELGDRIIMLDELSKTENIGSIIRSVAALGMDSMIVPRLPNPYGRRALRVSMGHIGKLGIHAYDDRKKIVSELKNLGYTIYAAEVTPDARNLADINPPQKWVLIVGNEDLGVHEDFLGLCDSVVKIEMRPDIKSFNVAVATSIILYKFLYL